VSSDRHGPQADRRTLVVLWEVIRRSELWGAKREAGERLARDRLFEIAAEVFENLLLALLNFE
jgi:hypothetical protein